MRKITSYFYTDGDVLIGWENDAERKGFEGAKGIEARAQQEGVVLVWTVHLQKQGERWTMRE